MYRKKMIVLSLSENYNMIKRIPKILKLIFVLIFVFQLIGLAVLFAWPEITQAADINFKPQITIPGFDTEARNAGMQGSETAGYSINGNSIGALIKSIYKYAIGIVGIVAAIVMMIGGFMWLIAGGNQSKISEAQEWVKASLTGLILALGSYMILATVNPALTTFTSLDIKTVTKINSNNPVSIATGCCEATKSCSVTTRETCAATFQEGYACNQTTGKCEISSYAVPLKYKECDDNNDCKSGFFCNGASKTSGVRGKCEAVQNTSACTPEINKICNEVGTVCVVINNQATCPEPDKPLSTIYKK